MVGVGTRLRVLPMAAMVSCAAASAQDAPRSYAAVVCTSEASGPWAEKVNRLALLIGSKCPQPKPPRRM
jgi:hypothetical protein